MEHLPLIATRLRLSLEKAHMKQVKLAEKTGIPKSAISQYLSGKIKPKQDKVRLMAKALDVSELWLMGWEEPEEASSPALTPQEETHIKKYRQLDADGKSKAPGVTSTRRSAGRVTSTQPQYNHIHSTRS